MKKSINDMRFEIMQKANGGIVNQDYKGVHLAPTNDGYSAPLHEMNKIYPDDIYSSNAKQYYGDSNPKTDPQSINAIHAARNKPNDMITMYRAVPKQSSPSKDMQELNKHMSGYMKNGKIPAGEKLKGSDWYNDAYDRRSALEEKSKDEKPLVKPTINHGDWVTLSHQYAKEHGEAALNGKYSILSKKVPARHLYTDANSIHEFGYDPTVEKEKAILKKATGGSISQDAMQAAVMLKKPKGLFGTINDAAQALKRSKGTGAEFMSEVMKHPSSAREVQARNLQGIAELPQMSKAEFMTHLQQKPDLKVNATENPDNQYEEYQMPGGKNYREMLLQLGNNKGAEYNSSHFEQPNILAHLRMSDRVGDKGEKILHLEELQSDWHQQGRKHGYKTEQDKIDKKVAQNALKALEAKRELHRDFMNESEKRMLDPNQPPERMNENKDQYVYHLDQVLNHLPLIMKARDALDNMPGDNPRAVPDAPYKANWHELGIKHLLHHAANNGYDKVTVTPGEEQVKRFQDEGLRQHYDVKIPSALNKFGKQFGTEVGSMPIKNGEETTHIHSMDITPEMREHIQSKGLPLYAEGGRVLMENVGVDEAPDMDVKEYILPKFGFGGVEMPQQPPAQPAQTPQGTAPQQGIQAPPSGHPLQPPSSLPTRPTGPAALSNILQLTQQGKAMNAIQPPAPQVMGKAKGGIVNKDKVRILPSVEHMKMELLKVNKSKKVK